MSARLFNKLKGFYQDLSLLKRFFLLKTPWFRICLHNIVAPDNGSDYPHDHPWSFVRLILSGGYTEQIYNRDYKLLETKKRKIFRVDKKDFNFVHKIVNVKPNTWTLFITGPKRKEWGFITEGGWIFWREYFDYWGEEEID